MILLVVAWSAVALVLGVESQYLDYPQQPSSHRSYGGDLGGSYGRGHGAGQGGHGTGGGYGSSSGASDESYQTETKYYYGGKYQGSCSTDGLYYFDDTMFVICSNGYPHEQPCPPGTKTSGSPKYQAGYYYGYTDLCSVNLVDYGYGPEYYAPKGYPVAGDGYDDKANGKDAYPSKSREYGSYESGVGSGHKQSYPKDSRSPYPDTKSAYPARDTYPQTDTYSSKYKDTYPAAKGAYGATPEKKYR